MMLLLEHQIQATASPRGICHSPKFNTLFLLTGVLTLNEPDL